MYLYVNADLPKLCKPLFIYLQLDPLYYGKINMDPSEKAQLNSGDKVCHSFMQNKTNVPLKVFYFALNLARGCPKVSLGLII